MGRKSIKENKNIYHISRENAGLTREEAGNRMSYVSADRIERIENERLLPHPEDVLEMSKCYKDPSLRNQYCAKVCPLGTGHILEVESKMLSQITLEVLASLNALEEQKNRFIEITVDGEISEDEYHDFALIQTQLNNISGSIHSLQLWMEQMVMEEKIDMEKLERALRSLS